MTENIYPADTKIIEIRGSTIQNHSAVLRLKCKGKEEFLKWLETHQTLSGVTFRVQSSKNVNGKTVLYKALYRCQHNTLPWQHGTKKPSKKHTQCEAKMSVTIKSSPSDRKVRTKDEFREEFPTSVTISHVHNHLINGAEAVKYKDPNHDVKEKFIDMFKSHHPPARALYLYKQDLQEEYEDNFYQVAADRSVCPDLQWVYRFYYSKFKEEFGNEKVDLPKRLEELKITYSEQGIKMKYECLSHDEYVIALCTPLMERVHSLDLASHMVFIDSSGNMDRYNSRIFLLMCDSKVGGLPLGIFLSTSESEAAITKGLKLLKEILPDHCFGQNESGGPAVFMSDDSTAQQNALINVFPASSIWICTFHVLQSVWRWLMDKKHGVDECDRQDLYKLFKEVLVSKTDEDFSNHVSTLLDSLLVRKYPLFKTYIVNLLGSAEKWSHNLRTLSRGNNTNNIVERAMGVLKDKILCRTRAYNISQLLHFLCISLPEYYQQKIIDVISGRYQSVSQMRYLPKEGKFENLEITDRDASVFTVKNNKTKTSYSVNIDIGVCTCEVGKNGAPCKHQHYVSVSCKVSCANTVPTTEEEKCFFHYLATGSSDVPNNWYAPLSTKGKPSDEEIPASTSISSETCKMIVNKTSEDDMQSVGLCTSTKEVLLEAEKTVDEISKILKQRLATNPEIFSEALVSFHSTLVKMKTETSLVSALHSFAKPSYLPLKARKYRTTIPVQPTSIARRKAAIKGRRCIQSGRPAKARFTVEHGYSKIKNRSQLAKAPHCLQECVDRNCSAAKKH